MVGDIIADSRATSPGIRSPLRGTESLLTLRWREMDSNSRFNNSEPQTKLYHHFSVDFWDKKWDKIPISTGVYDGQTTT